MSILEENTLGVIVGRGRRSASTRRSAAATAASRVSLGMSFLALGALIVVVLRAIYGIAVFLVTWPEYPLAIVSVAAWAALAVVIAMATIAARITGDRLSTPLFVVFLIGVATAFALDLVGTWSSGNPGRFAVAAASAGIALLAAVASRGRLDVVLPAIGFGLAFAVVAVVSASPESLNDVGWVSEQLGAIALVVVPPIVGAVAVAGFRRMVQLELDRVLVQSTVQAPRFAVGMLASEELARLDLAAEELFERIADGRTELPLHPKTASVAASLATELRLHLLEGRRETWLYHAVSESEMLGRYVSLSDKSSLAGLLDPAQRDGLLAAMWLLVSDTPRASETRHLDVAVGPVDASAGSPVPGKIVVPITLTTTGIPRNRVDPAIWDALARVGQYSDSTHESSVRVDIVCHVDNPADA